MPPTEGETDWNEINFTLLAGAYMQKESRDGGLV